MALSLTPEEQAYFDKQNTNQPAEVVIPPAEDFANGTATGDDIQVIAPSGVDQDIEQNDNAIESLTTDIAKYNEALSFSSKMMNHFHSIIRGYETERRALSGSYEITPWELGDVSPSKNIYHGNSSRHFPQGTQTNPMEATAFPEEEGNGPKTTIATNLAINLATLASLLPGYQNASTIVPDTPEGAQSPAQIALVAIAAAANNADTAFTDEYTKLVATESDSYHDDRQDSIDQAAARLLLNSVDHNTLASLMASGYKGSGYTQFMAQVNAMQQSITDRLDQITSLLTSTHYAMRTSFSLELVDIGEGLVYKLLQAESSMGQLLTKQKQLARKKKTFGDLSSIL